MRLCADPFSRPYAEYRELAMAKNLPSLIIFHRKPTQSPSVEVEIALYPKIHQAPSLDTLIHTVFSALAINYANQGYMDG
jgi:hypothetical protein